jgi:hypothetical protein
VVYIIILKLLLKLKYLNDFKTNSIKRNRNYELI